MLTVQLPQLQVLVVCAVASCLVVADAFSTISTHEATSGKYSCLDAGALPTSGPDGGAICVATTAAAAAADSRSTTDQSFGTLEDCLAGTKKHNTPSIGFIRFPCV